MGQKSGCRGIKCPLGAGEPEIGIKLKKMVFLFDN